MDFLRQAIAEADWQTAAYRDETDSMAGYTIDHLCATFFRSEEIYGGHIRGQEKDVYMFRVGNNCLRVRVDWKRRVAIALYNNATSIDMGI